MSSYVYDLKQLSRDEEAVDLYADDGSGGVVKEGTSPTEMAEIDGGEVARLEVVGTLNADGKAGGRKRWYRTREGEVVGRL